MEVKVSELFTWYESQSDCINVLKTSTIVLCFQSASIKVMALLFSNFMAGKPKSDTQTSPAWSDQVLKSFMHLNFVMSVIYGCIFYIIC